MSNQSTFVNFAIELACQQKGWLIDFGYILFGFNHSKRHPPPHHPLWKTLQGQWSTFLHSCFLVEDCRVAPIINDDMKAFRNISWTNNILQHTPGSYEFWSPSCLLRPINLVTIPWATFLARNSILHDLFSFTTQEPHWTFN